ncbi:MAG: DUF1566 domain-containing protein [Rhodoferax sp.]|nr:DUF1566 domain-containing protein [Rhodoferax sp.]
MAPTSTICSVLRWLLACLLLLIAPFAQATLTINNDGTVTDPNTGLTWMRCSMGQTWDGSTCTGSANIYSFYQAEALTSTVTFAGQSDWRMPNIRELQTIVDRSVYSPAIASGAFPNTPSWVFWSGSPDANTSYAAWSVYFGDGFASRSRNKSEYLAFRMVRGGQSFDSLLAVARPTSDYVDNGNGTVTHTPTNLTWKRCAQGQTWTGSTCSGTASFYTFDQANTLTGTTTFAGQNDWRVPTENELISLVDYSIVQYNDGPAINSSVFPAIPDPYFLNYFWSASPQAGSSTNAWYIDFDLGNAYNYDRSSNFAVRLVRGGQPAGSFVLAVSKSGTGTGTVTSSPTGISCGSTCSASLASGTSRTLTATPATGSTFTGWSGACTGTGSCTISMTAAKSITATFSLNVTAPVCTLSANPTTITAGGSSTLTASCTPAATSYTWTGGTCAGTTGATCTVTPTVTTTYAVAGTNAGGTGAAVGATVTVPVASTLYPNADGTVTDASTGLTWMRCAMGQTWDGSTCAGTVSTYTFAQANALTNTVTFAGQSDWRMPNIRELQTIVNRSVYSPAIDSAAFPNTPGSYFWSGSSYANASISAWRVYFLNGHANGDSTSSTYAVRLVRAGQLQASLLNIARPASDYVASSDGTVTHSPTNLMWKRCVEGLTWTGSTCSGTINGMTFEQAAVFSSGFAGYSDWRLPTEEELLSLVDYSTHSPTINSSIFPVTPSAISWSASPYANSSSRAWGVDFDDGHVYDNGRNGKYAFRLVRNGQSAAPLVLTVSKSGTGTGTVTSSPTGINCGTTCSASFTSGTSVTLTATPATGNMFTGWSGACTGTGSCTVSMTAVKSVTATFSPSVQPLPCTLSASPTTITVGSSSTLTASCNPAASSYTWTGGTCAGTTGATCTVTPTATTTYTVAGTNAGGTGTAPSVTVTVTVNPCTYALGTSSASVAASASTGNVISVTASCAWTATSNASWLTITSGASGSGSGSVGYTVAANTGTSSRTGTLTIAGQTFTVTQGISPPSCTLDANPSSITAGSSSTLTASCIPAATSYTWTGGTCAGTTGATCTVTPTATTTYTVAGTNAGGTGTAPSVTVNVCTYALGASSASVSASASTGSVNVTSSCAWTATSNASWITISSGASGSGSGSVGYAVVANTGTSSRTGTLTIAGQTFTVTQGVSPPSCILDANPSSITVGGSSILTASCTPTATSYTWTGGTCAGTTGTTCTVTPTATTTYTVTGTNAGGTGAAASATVTSPNADGTVFDPKTGLTWMRCSMGQTWDGSTCIGTANTYTYDQANALIGTVTFAGQNDWRMPNIRELQTIVDRSVYNPAIDSIAFPNTPSLFFWSGSPDVGNSDYAWMVSFYLGSAYDGYRYDDYYAVRLVRGGQSFGSLLSVTRPTSDYVDNGNGTVTHTPTNLTWKRCVEGQIWNGSTCTGTASTYSFDQAKALTGTATFAGQSDWNLPTEDELLSLVDYTIAAPGPTINSNIFPATPSSYFWSGSTYDDSSSYAWYVSFSFGAALGYDHHSGYNAVRLVRGGQSVGSFVLAISKSGMGTGTVTSNPTGINCGSTCSASFTSGTSVTLTATPTTGSTFTGWSGACSGTGSCTVGMTGTRSVTATFALSVPPPPCTLSANPATITAGVSSTLTASCSPAATGYTWTGGTCAGTTGATCTVTPTATTTYTVTGTNADGTGTAASATVTVNPCTYTLGTSSASVAASASTGNVSVTSSCAWTATSNVSWISITSGASGSGNGTVAYTVAANTGTAARMGTLTIAGKTVTVTQSSSTLQVNADGTVTDLNTGLTWMRCSMGQTWDGSTCTGTASTYTFDKANALTGTVTFAGQNDWRMPNIRELQTIVDRSVYNPAIDSAAFPNTLSSAFFSGSPYTYDSSYAWYVEFYYGGSYNYRRSSNYAVRMVRGGQSVDSLLSITRPTNDYVDHGDGTVTHTPTNLTWKRCIEGQTWTGSTCTGTASTYTVDQANTLTGTTTFAGQIDWRLPTEDELLSLVDYNSYNPAINISIFPSVPSSRFLSSSPDVGYSYLMWVVDFDYGGAYHGYGNYVVRLVRGGQSSGSLVLAVSKSGTGTGTVTSGPTGINCGTTCSASFTSGTSVTLTATPATGSTFTNWGGACSDTGSCTVSMTETRSVTAAFSLTAPVCTVSANPASITVGSSSTLTASCSPTATSYTWTGGTCAGTTGATCTVTPTATTTYTVAGTNAGGTGTAASATVTVACTYALGTSSASFSAPASTGNVSVTSSCAWTATSNVSWITITSGASGSGNGTVAYTVDANAGTSARTGTLTIAGKTFTVTQSTSTDDGTVTDLNTGLTWMRCAMGQTWTGSDCSGAATAYTFYQANALTGTVTFANQSDWRMPNNRELQTIVDRSAYSPTIDSAAFPNTPSAYFWSGSSFAQTSNLAWRVYFLNGYADYENLSSNPGSSHAVRLVRGGQSQVSLLNIARPASDYVANSDGTATHGPTNLMWKRCVEGQTWTGSTCSNTTINAMTFEQATAFSSVFAGYSDWRLPTEEELLSLVDYSTDNPAINSSIFPITPRAASWSNSPYVNSSIRAWGVDFSNGYVYDNGRNGSYAVRLVRGGRPSGSFVLAVSKSGTGTGTVTSVPDTINCGSTCSVALASGTSVTLTATPATGSTFAGWSGACTGTDSCVVSMTETKNVIAMFNPMVCTLSANPSSITVGSSATLTASCSPAATSYTWTGGTCAGTTGATCTATPAATTTYTVAGTNAGGTSAADSTIVIVTFDPDGTVFDPKTGLTWMRCAMGQTWTGSTCSGAAKTYTFDGANALTGTVEFANQSDWRMPTIRELQTIVDRSVYSPAINSAAFPNTPRSSTWSGSPSANGSTLAWLVHFNYGGAYYGNQGNSYTVRLVRGGQSFGPLLDIARPTSDYVDNGDGTVTHTPTTLTWKRCAQGQTWTGSLCIGTASTYTFDLANALTGTTTFAGKSDWRLPTVNELVSLVDYAISSPGPMINSSIFPATPGLNFWSYSPYASDSSSAWFVHFLDGDTYNGSRGDGNAVRMVRGGLFVDSFVVTVDKSGAGAGTITSAPAGISCASTCSATFTRGTSVTLTATPSTGSTFTGWSGACTGTGSCSVTAAKSVNATFALTTPPPVCRLSANPASITAGSSATLTASCTPAATSYTWTGGTCAGSTGTTCTVTPTATTTYTVAGTNAGGTGTVDSASVTVTTPGGAPVCTLRANPASITAGGSSTLTATCNPAATSYIWTFGACVSTSATCTVKPTVTTAYGVQGSNAGGTNLAVSAAVTVTANTTSYTVPGTLGNDVFVLTAGNSYYGGAGNDTYIISPSTLRDGVTARIIDSEGDNLIQLVDGMTVTASSFYTDAAQLTLSGGATVQILGASKFKFQVGANAPAGDTATILTYAQFVSSLGASLTSGTLPASGTAGYVVPTGFTQASAPAPAVVGSSYTVPGTLGDDVLVPSGGNNYLGGGGNDVYIISPYTLSGTVTAKIIDSEGANVIQLVNGMTIASSTFYNNAMQLTLSNGATVQILGASGFVYQLGANAPAGETASSLSYAQFAATLGASVPTGTSAVSGSANFVVSR